MFSSKLHIATRKIQTMNHCVRLFTTTQMNNASQTMLVIGGCGALGHAVIETATQKNWECINIDLKENEMATKNIPLQGESNNWKHQVQDIKSQLGVKPDAIVCTAGGWAGGSIDSEDTFDAVEAMYNACIKSSVTAAHLASTEMKEGGLLVLVGAAAAQNPTPGMIGYGIAKNSTHFLLKSISEPNAGLPKDAKAVAVLPNTIDTPMNRQGMPNADTSTWTPLSVFAEKIVEWCSSEETRPQAGAMMECVTKDNQSEWREV